MGNFSTTITNFINSARPIVIAVAAAALLIDGIMMVYPNERSKEKAKEALPWVVIGSAIALGAVAIANSIGSSF